MKIEKVNYQKAYVIGPYLQQKIGFEVSLDEGDSPEDAITAMKKLADKWHEENNPHLEMSAAPQYQLPDEQTGPRKTKNEIILESINNSTDISVLKSYYLLAKQDPVTLSAYEEKMKQFSGK